MRKNVIFIVLVLCLVIVSCDQKPTSHAVVSRKDSSSPTKTDTQSSTSPKKTYIYVPNITPTYTPTHTPTLTPTFTPTYTEIVKPTLPPSGSMEEVCAASIFGIDELKKDLGFPDHYMEENPKKQEGDFDPNSYFTVLNRLSILPGYTLDYVYFNDYLGGKPLIYARPIDQEPYATYEDFIDAVGDTSYEEKSYDYLENAHAYMDYIQTDDTAEGYLQFVILATLGDQFYLFWHALYNDDIFMCISADIDKVIAEVDSFGIEFPDDVAKEAESIDFEPAVTLDEKTATVQFVIFTKWGGFIEVWYKITREFPHTVVDGGSRVLVEYDCGIMF